MNKIVYQNDGTVPVDEILCTTYQMRNFYRQLRDGFFSDLDVMNYIQHISAARTAKPGDVVLDLCCGRGLMLPLLRYHSKNIQKYIGVDIQETNMIWRNQIVSSGKPLPEDYYPFETQAIVGNVAEIESLVSDPIDLAIYTSSIEHMHKDHGEKSVEGLSRIINPGGTLFLSYPNTPEDQDGFDVKYKAHVYEWKRSELLQVLDQNGFQVVKEIGLTGDLRKFKTIVKELPKPLRIHYESIINYVPREFLKPFLFLHIPKLASEILIIATKK